MLPTVRHFARLAPGITVGSSAHVQATKQLNGHAVNMQEGTTRESTCDPCT